jgi:hypothetical protein
MRYFRIEAWVNQTPVNIPDEERITKGWSVQAAYNRAAKVLKKHTGRKRYRHRINIWTIRLWGIPQRKIISKQNDNE